MPFAAVNEIDVYFELHGTGAPLLNISGSGNDLRRSSASILPVNKAFETLSYDQRGLGQTSKPESDYTMADYADDAAALIHSSYPLHELGRLDPDEAFAMRCRLTDRRFDPYADEPIPGLGAYYDLMVEQSHLPPDPEQMTGLARQLRARAGHDVVEALASIDHPTLVCAGQYDDIAPVANSELIVERMPNATLAVFDGGHTFLIQDRSAFPAIIEFLESTGGAS